MGALDLGSFVSGAVSGVNNGLDVAQQVNTMRDEEKARQARDQLGARFREAARQGGLGKMPDDWWTGTASLLADTGDFEGAVKLADLGTTFRVRRGQTAAQRAAARAAAGDLNGAAVDINEAFEALGAPTRVAGVAVDQQGMPLFQTADGGAIPAGRLGEIAMTLTTAPLEAYKANLDAMETRSTIRRDQSAIDLNQAKTSTEEALRGPRVQSELADAASGYASAASSRASAARTQQATAFEAQTLPLDLAGKQVDLQKGVLDLTEAQDTSEARTGKTRAEAQAAEAAAVQARADADVAVGTVGSRISEAGSKADKGALDLSVAEATAPAVVAKAGADAFKAQVDARGADKRFSDLAAQLETARARWQETNSDPLGEPAANAYLSGLSDEMAETTYNRAIELLTEDPNLAATQALVRANNDMTLVIRGLMNANPGVITDPRQASALAAMITTSGDQLQTRTDETGREYVEVDSGGSGTVRVYLDPPTTGALDLNAD